MNAWVRGPRRKGAARMCAKNPEAAVETRRRQLHSPGAGCARVALTWMMSVVSPQVTKQGKEEDLATL